MNSGEVLAELRLVGGHWRSMHDYQETIEQNLGGSSKERNLVLAALHGVKHKFGAELANGVIEAYGLESQGFEMFKTGPAAQ